MPLLSRGPRGAVAASLLALALATVGPLARPERVLAAAPSNDNIANAATLTGSSGAVSGSTAEATTDRCHIFPPRWPARSVWYRWTAPFTGWARFRTDGSSFNAMVAVAPAAEPCPFGSDPMVRLEVKQGSAYLLGVGSTDGSGGSFVLSWTLRRPPLPPNDAFAKALQIYGRNGQSFGSNANGSKEAGEPAHAAQAGGRSIWFRWRAPASGRAAFHTIGSESDTNTLLAVYTGTSVAALTRIASDNDSGLQATSRLVFEATAGVTYHVAVDTVGGRETTLGTCRGWAQCGIQLTWNTGPGPSNDAFSGALPVSGDGGGFWAQNVGARLEPGEPSHAEDRNWVHPIRGGASVWYRWVAPATGRALFSAGSPDFVPLVAIYRGGSLTTLETVAENDYRWISDGGWTHRSADWQATKGETYYVAIDAEFEQTGQYRVDWQSRPVNDDFAGATALTTAAGRIVDSNSGGSREDAAGEPNHERLEGAASVWYAWTPPASGAAVVDTSGTDSDHRLAVYTGSSLSSLSEVGTREYFSGGWRRVTFTATAGTTYRIAVDSALFGSGFHLNWRVGPTESTPPAITLTGPPDAARVPGMVTWGAEASDASGIARVLFLVNGS